MGQQTDRKFLREDMKVTHKYTITAGFPPHHVNKNEAYTEILSHPSQSGCQHVRKRVICPGSREKISLTQMLVLAHLQQSEWRWRSLNEIIQQPERLDTIHQNTITQHK